jgi:hypothetical protein
MPPITPWTQPVTITAPTSFRAVPVMFDDEPLATCQISEAGAGREPAESIGDV